MAAAPLGGHPSTAMRGGRLFPHPKKNSLKSIFIKNRETAFAQPITWRTGEAFIRRKSDGARAIRAFSDQHEALQALTAGRIDEFVWPDKPGIHPAPGAAGTGVKSRRFAVHTSPCRQRRRGTCRWVHRHDHQPRAISTVDRGMEILSNRFAPIQPIQDML
ncbi:hypothetical protein [Desulfosarcina alkanivorans]|uniref:hypothetical protein n=1 Tax=Desulfosarcina alkanivorans TaxID=571177 RepID=UPI0012D37247|nr:hypothetical protein [Desulfosarcina alkanivorans]